jgi:hypothetical protein
MISEPKADLKMSERQLELILRVMQKAKTLRKQGDRKVTSRSSRRVWP